MIALLKQYKLIALAVAVLVLMALSAAGAWQWQANSYERQLSDILAANETAARIAQAQARSEEQRRQIAIEGIRRDAQDKIAAVAADAAAADDAAGRLRARVAELSRRPASCPGAAGGGEAGEQSGMVLADVFARLDRRAGELAEAYDRARIAGLACEAAYDSLTR